MSYKSVSLRESTRRRVRYGHKREWKLEQVGKDGLYQKSNDDHYK